MKEKNGGKRMCFEIMDTLINSLNLSYEQWDMWKVGF